MVFQSKRMMIITQFVVCVVLLSSMSNAFVVPRSGIVSQFNSHKPLFMASAEEEAERLREQASKLRAEAAELSGTPETEEKEVAVATEETSAVPTSGTFYDDEVQPTRKDPLSDSMRQRLMNEASTGLDSDSKQTNVILYISIAVFVLVVLGGQGILY